MAVEAKEESTDRSFSFEARGTYDEIVEAMNKIDVSDDKFRNASPSAVLEVKISFSIISDDQAAEEKPQDEV